MMEQLAALFDEEDKKNVRTARAARPGQKSGGRRAA
jgi:hypothetical protein